MIKPETQMCVCISLPHNHLIFFHRNGDGMRGNNISITTIPESNNRSTEESSHVQSTQSPQQINTLILPSQLPKLGFQKFF